MLKKKILLAIPVFIAVATIIRCWIEILLSNSVAQWQHYSAIVCASVVIYFFFRKLPQAVIATAVFLTVGTFNAFSMTSHIITTRIAIFGIPGPPFNSLALGLLFLFLVLNLVTMINLHLDNKEKRNALKAQSKKVTVSMESKIEH